jgi:prepilin-type N-terminal cleavage/methylation domain-containing protein
MQKKIGSCRTKRYRGLTLVELLVVLGVVSVLTAIVLPSIKTVLTDRKSSQTAITVKSFFEAARARAIGKNRSVSVVLERLSSRVNPFSTPFVSETASATVTSPVDNFVPYNACIRMSLAEEPLPFTESMLPTLVTMRPRGIAVPETPNFPTDDYVDEDSVVDSHDGGAEIRAFNVQGPEAALRVLASHLIAGSEISFGDSKRKFTIVSPRTPQVHKNFIDRHPGNPPPQGIWFSIVNELAEDESGERASPPYVAFTVPSPNGVSRFKVYTRPKPIYSEMVQLPRGMCIDLSLSGFAMDTIRNDVPSSPSTQPVFDKAGPIEHPLSDYRVRFASDWIGNGGTPTPEQLRPIYITFTADGILSHVWTNERSGPNLIRIDATQDIFLHIGKIDQIVMPIDPAIGGRNKAALDAVAASGVRQNLTDLNSYIIRLSPKTGTITASPAVGLDTQIGILGLKPDGLSLGDLIELSRRGTYSSNVTSQ